MPKIKKIYPRTYTNLNDELITEFKNGSFVAAKGSRRASYDCDGILRHIYSADIHVSTMVKIERAIDKDA